MGCFQSNCCKDQKPEADIDVPNNPDNGLVFLKRPSNRNQRSIIFVKDYQDQASEIAKIGNPSSLIPTSRVLFL